MARARNIKPSIFKNELLGVADPLLTILFQSLWCLADREGRLEDRPLRIKAETFPYRDGLDVNVYLTELERLGFIVRYVVEGVGYIQVANFTKHQNPHKTEKHSEIPPAPEKTVEKSDSCAITVKDTLNNGCRPADSLLLIPDSFQIPPNPLAGGEASEQPLAEKPKRKSAIALKTFIENCVRSGEKPISGYDALLTYVDDTGLPMEFVQLAWEVFKREFMAGGVNENRLQKDWRRHFLNYVKKGYYRLWFAKQVDGGFEYSLTTQGIQAKAESSAKVAG